MRAQTHKLNNKEEKARLFLAEGRKDPVTGETFASGDEVVFCAACKSAFLKDSWDYMGGKHCGQHKTLTAFPNSKKGVLKLERKDVLRRRWTPKERYQDFYGILNVIFFTTMSIVYYDGANIAFFMYALVGVMYLVSAFASYSKTTAKLKLKNIRNTVRSLRLNSSSLEIRYLFQPKIRIPLVSLKRVRLRYGIERKGWVKTFFKKRSEFILEIEDKRNNVFTVVFKEDKDFEQRKKLYEILNDLRRYTEDIQVHDFPNGDMLPLRNFNLLPPVSGSEQNRENNQGLS